MKLLNKMDGWADTHHPMILDLIRGVLGVVIFLKGLYFISHTEELQLILRNSKFPWISFGIAHYVALAHLAGGIFIAIGMYTRLSIAFQLPILVGAVVFVHSTQGFFSYNPDLYLSLGVLSLLVFYFVYGGGYFSVDHSWREEDAH
jgi:uncharacterized membrane protein YphA (DoxX/SURF4 family)